MITDIKDDEIVEPHVYTLRELGRMYFPTAMPESQSRQLKRWISINKNLVDALNKNGYQDRQRYLTPKQVSLIFEFLGDP